MKRENGMEEKETLGKNKVKTENEIEIKEILKKMK